MPWNAEPSAGHSRICLTKQHNAVLVTRIRCGRLLLMSRPAAPADWPTNQEARSEEDHPGCRQGARAEENKTPGLATEKQASAGEQRNVKWQAG